MTQDESKLAVNQGTAPFSVEAVPWEEWAQGTRFGSRLRRLGDFGGGSHVGVVMEELSPGKQSSAAHYHLLEEEHVLVLDGQMTLRSDPDTYELAAGDYVCFPAGRTVAHTFINTGSAPCRFLVIGERNPHDVIVYPDSNKVLVRLTGEVYQKAPVDYWEGEKTDESVK